LLRAVEKYFKIKAKDLTPALLQDLVSMNIRIREFVGRWFKERKQKMDVPPKLQGLITPEQYADYLLFHTRLREAEKKFSDREQKLREEFEEQLKAARKEKVVKMESIVAESRLSARIAYALRLNVNTVGIEAQLDIAKVRASDAADDVKKQRVLDIILAYRKDVIDGKVKVDPFLVYTGVLED
jgi:hypothetical protein